MADTAEVAYFQHLGQQRVSAFTTVRCQKGLLHLGGSLFPLCVQAQVFIKPFGALSLVTLVSHQRDVPVDT